MSALIPDWEKELVKYMTGKIFLLDGMYPMLFNDFYGSARYKIWVEEQKKEREEGNKNANTDS